jgi:glycosyltransferase involved in cell wall biosynthesis
VFYNETTRARFQADHGWDPSRLFVALNSLDQTPVQRSRASWLARPTDLAAFRHSNNLYGRPVYLFVSRLEADNRVDLLIDALVEVRQQCPDACAVIVGKGPAEDSLRAHATQRGLSDAVRFVGAIYDEEQLAPWFLSATAFCYPCNIGLSLLHAFGYGVPVVTCDDIASQNPEIEALRHGQNGFLYRTGDVHDLSRHLVALAASPELRQRLSAEALQTVTEQFTLDRMVDGMASAIRRAAAG